MAKYHWNVISEVADNACRQFIVVWIGLHISSYIYNLRDLIIDIYITCDKDRLVLYSKYQVYNIKSLLSVCVVLMS